MNPQKPVKSSAHAWPMIFFSDSARLLEGVYLRGEQSATTANAPGFLSPKTNINSNSSNNGQALNASQVANESGKTKQPIHSWLVIICNNNNNNNPRLLIITTIISYQFAEHSGLSRRDFPVEQVISQSSNKRFPPAVSAASMGLSINAVRPKVAVSQL